LNKLKKYLSISLLFVFLLQIAGPYPWLKISLHFLQIEINEKMRDISDPDGQILLVISESQMSEISWKEKNKEFSYHNEMFDVVKLKYVGNKRYYYCLKDSKEKELIFNYLKHCNARKTMEKKIKNTLTSNYLPQYLFVRLYTPVLNFIYTEICENYISKIPEIVVPPPQL
jgi:hypothetical protein